MSERPHDMMAPLPGREPEIGLWMAALENCRYRTLHNVTGLSAEALDAPPPFGVNTIGSLLYHIAESTVGWLYGNYLEQEYPPDVAELFPYGDRDEQGLLAALRGEPLDKYLHRLSVTHEKMMDAYKGMSLEEFHRSYTRQGWDDKPFYLTPARMVNHLMQHEAEHRGHIQMIIESLAQSC